MSAAPLWTSQAMREAMRAAAGGNCRMRSPAFRIDSRSIKPGEPISRIKGDVHDGHAFVDAALKAGAALAVRRDRSSAESSLPHAPLLVVDDVLQGLCDARGSRPARG